MLLRLSDLQCLETLNAQWCSLQFPIWQIHDRGYGEFTGQKTNKIYLCAMFTKVILCSGNYSPTGKQDFAIGPTDRTTVSNVRVNLYSRQFTNSYSLHQFGLMITAIKYLLNCSWDGKLK